jgi:sterol desaturase/sphingolipid hydroxylase (fatty acid hydroxylase superfamily)
MSFIAIALETWFDGLLARFPAGWVEVFADVSIQLTYLAFGLIVELVRPPYSSKTSKKMILQSIRNHCVGAGIHIAYVFYKGGAPVLSSTYARPFIMPSLKEIVGDLVMALVLRDAICYLIHRFWHLPGVYEKVHAKHHEITKPGEHHCWTVSYMSVTDFILLYGGPVVVIAKMLELSIVTVAIFAFISAVGEQVKLVYGDESHDEHHINGTVNFGTYGFMDSLCGTSGASASHELELSG